MSKAVSILPLNKVLKRRKDEIKIQEIDTYTRITIRMNGQGIVIRDRVSGSEIGTKKQFITRAGQLVLSKIDARNGAFGILQDECDGAIITGNFWAFDVNPELLDAQYFDYLTKTPLFIDFCIRASDGTTNRRYLQESKFLAMEIPLPSREEQRRVVARVEELVGKIEEARSLRKQALEETEALLPSNRKEVFEKLSNELTAVRLDSVAYSQLGKMLSPKSKTGIGSTPYLRNANVQWDRLNLSNVYEMDFTEKEKQKFSLKVDDILVCEGGDIGKSAIWNDEIPGCCYQKTLHRIRVDTTKLIPRFMLHNIFWAGEEGHFADIKTQTTIAHLTGVKLKAYKVFVPLISEQRRIVAYLDNLQGKVDEMKRLREESMKELDAMLPSILDKAFKGEL